MRIALSECGAKPRRLRRGVAAALEDGSLLPPSNRIRKWSKSKAPASQAHSKAAASRPHSKGRAATFCSLPLLLIILTEVAKIYQKIKKLQVCRETPKNHILLINKEL